MANNTQKAEADSQEFEFLCEATGLSFPAISTARSRTEEKVSELSALVKDSGIELGDTLSLVVFGSLARREWTSGSDIDWTLLVDGPVLARHHEVALDIERILIKAKLVAPGATGIFGTLASSHDLVHHIGGESDSNRNMTRRILLLLESRAIVGKTVRTRVLRAILERYIRHGRGVADGLRPDLHVPRFLFNDVVRYWRTVAVDYAAKKWEKGDQGWGLRNAKLRVSRKMTFVKGLLLCFDCELFSGKSPWLELGADGHSQERLIAGCSGLAEKTPIDLLCRFFTFSLLEESSLQLFKSYDEFLGLLDDTASREHLKNLAFDNAADDGIFMRVRRGIGDTFADELRKLFFESFEPLTKLTQKYGVF